MAVRRTGPGVAVLTAALRSLDGVQAKTGWFETAKYADGTPVAYVATIHEFGAIVVNADAVAGAYQNGGGGAAPILIPARPFMRPTVAAKGDSWMKLLAQGAAQVLLGKATAEQVLEAVALRAAGDVAKTISTISSPPLSPRTIAGKKGATKPLVDTGQMIQSVTGVVERHG